MSERTRVRLDEALVLRGLAPSRSRARDMVKRGTVSVDGEPEVKPARLVEPSQAIAVHDPAARYVSRAALKLVAGLEAFGFDPAGHTILDLGASTGGFTQVLLERRAEQVVAVDVGHGEMDAALRDDRRVTLIEGLNARDLGRDHLAGRKIHAIVADLSFISLKLALPPALGLAQPGAWGIFLVKPQFEVGRKALGKDGVVRDPEIARGAAEDIATWLEASTSGHESAADPTAGTGHWNVIGLISSPIAGGTGNQELLLGARKAVPHA
jgi:23S rRNA (cytidine1920-2'-O)/16S rRNA (cytidine1409-2'-O)-methyltransferase